jgi:FkbM family methyltransferase
MRLRVRDRLVQEVRARDGSGDYLFRCTSATEVSRARSLFSKEPGTIAWLRATLRPSDVFWDVGANIGPYTMVAAGLVGAAGRVVSFEPHPVNFTRLLDNVRANGFGSTVTCLQVALHDRTGLADFHLFSEEPGSSFSQLDEPRTPDAGAFDAVLVEKKAAYRADDLIGEDASLEPSVVKIDVDGHELSVLRGMSGLLDRRAIRSLQVEVNATERGPVYALLERHGYALDHLHHTASGQRRLDLGAAPEDVMHNAVFRPAS